MKKGVIFLPNKKNFLTIRQEGQHELIIKKSRFITSLARTATVTQAQVFIEQTRQKYHTATHNTYAYTVGLQQPQVKASDNGEPSGTAGVPELKALQLMKLKNVTAVVTRYFGGIKLGAGGLIRAYTNSITAAVEKIGVVKAIWQQEYLFNLSYHYLKSVRHYLQLNQIAISKIKYQQDVQLGIYLNEQESKKVGQDLTNLLAGDVHFTKGRQRYHELPVKRHDFREE